MMQDPTSGNLIFFSISTIVIDAIDDELLLFWLEEALGFGGEVDNDEPTNGTDYNCNESFDKKDPFDVILI
jgi:hypothetical protein